MRLMASGGHAMFEEDNEGGVVYNCLFPSAANVIEYNMQ